MDLSLVRKILVIRTDNIGDLVCTTPLLTALKRLFPKAALHVLANSYNAPILLHHPEVDRVHLFVKEKHTGEPLWKSLLTQCRLMREIRRERFDLTIAAVSEPNRRYAIRAWASGASSRLGYAHHPKEGWPFHYTHPHSLADESLHEVERVLAFARILGFEGAIPSPSLRVTEEEKEKIAQKMGLGKDERPITLHVSSRKPANRWPFPHFAELIRLLRQDLPGRIQVLWAPGRENSAVFPGDDDRIGWLQEELSNLKNLSFVGGLTLREVMATLSLSPLLICCDGGAMHMAAALGTPVVTIFGNTNPTRWRPWGERQITLVPKNQEIQSILPLEVWTQARKLLSQ